MIGESNSTEGAATNSNSQLQDRGTMLPFYLAGVLALAAIYGAFKWWQVEQAALDRQQAVRADMVGPPLKDFELTERSGKTFRSAEMKGRVWVATYFFTTCPGSCLRLNQNIQLLHELPELKKVTWVSITCDPETDTIEALQEYADRYNADPERWIFCREELDYIKQVGKGMNLDVYRKGHKDYAIVFDRSGKNRGMFDATRRSQAQRLQALLLKCLAEEEPPKIVTATQKDGENS